MANIINNLGQVMLGWRSGIVTQVVNAVDADAQAFITAAGITNLVQAAAVSTLVNDLKTYGLWTKMKALYPMVGGSATSHKFNLKDPRDLDAAFRLVFNGGWVHSPTGAKPNGTTGYANTYFNPFTNLSTSLSSNHLSIYLRENIDEFKVDMGVFVSGTGVGLDIESRVSNVAYFLNLRTNSYISFANTDSRGLFINTRTLSNLHKVFINNTLKATDTNTSTISINGNISLGARYNTANATYELFSSKEQAFASIGDGLTDAEATNFYNSVQKFQTTLGRQISDTDAQAFITAASITDSTQQYAINTLVTDLKAASIWTKLKAVYPFVGGNATSHKFNLKSPGLTVNDFYLTFNGGGVHSVTGYKPNGTTGYADTGFVPYYAQYMQQNNNGIGVYLGTLNTASGTDPSFLGSYFNTTRASSLFVNKANTLISTRLNGSVINSTNITPLGLLSAQRTSSTSTIIYQNSTNVGSGNSGGPDLPQYNVYIGTINNGYGAYGPGYVNTEFRFVYMSDGLSSTEISTLYTAVQKYQTILGRQV